MGITDLDFGCGLSLAKYSGDDELDHYLGGHDDGDHGLGDHDDGGHGLGDHGDGDHHVGIFVDYSLAHEVGRIRLQL